MSSRIDLIPARFAVWIVHTLLPILALAKPSSPGSDHHRFASVADEFTTGLTSTVGWITISLEGGP